MKPSRMRCQQGAALLLLVAVIVMGSAWYILSRASSAQGDYTAADRNSNAIALNRTKQALIGYIAHQAAITGENNPGAFPCPEAASNIGTGNEGIGAGNCTLPAVGRVPWKTLGIEKPVDASGEPLWYVVANGWAKPNALTNTFINSNCTSPASGLLCATAQLTVDGQASAAVALVIAPGKAMNVAASAGCAARNQARATPSSTINPLDYLECYNAATSTFSTVAASQSFNDQVVKITAAEVLPGIEAGVTERFEREFGRFAATTQGLRNVYTATGWPATPVLPFALAFADPSQAAAYAPGAGHDVKGLLPLSYSETAPLSGVACTPSAAQPRCQPLFVAWTGGTVSGSGISNSTCTVATGTTTQLNCTFRYAYSIFAPPATIPFTLDATAANLGVALRQINTAAAMTNVNAAGRSATGTLAADGSGTITLTGTAPVPGGGGLLADLLCGLTSLLQQFLFDCYTQNISVPIFLVADHPLVDATSGPMDWFLRNKWHEVTYYAVAPNMAPGGSGSCATPPSATPCLVTNYHRNDGKQRGIILIAGSSLTGAARPNGVRSDWLEDANAVLNADGSVARPFTARAPTLLVNRTFNDHIGVVDSN